MGIIDEQIPAPGAAAPMETPAPTDSNAPPPEAQQSYDQLMTAALEVMYGDQTSDGVVKQLQAGAKNPPEALATGAMTILTTLDDQSKGTVPTDILAPVGEEVVEQLGEIASTAGLFPVEQGTFDQAALLLAEKLGSEYGGGPEEAQGLIDSYAPEEIEGLRAEQESFASTLQGLQGSINV